MRRGGGFLLRYIFKLAVMLIPLFVVVFLGLFAYQYISEVSLKPADDKDTAPLVVLGAQVKPDGSPSKQLKLRLDKAVELYKKAPRLIVVTGAKGKDEPEAEAEAMKKYLIKNGVDKEHIFSDDKSFNTFQNIKNAMALLPKGTKKINIVTSDYHLPRAISIAKSLKIEIGGYPSPTDPAYWLKNHLRETLAWGKYFLNRILSASEVID